MQKVYSRINWENDPSTNTPINEDNLNKIDYSLDKIDDRVIKLAGYEERANVSEQNASQSEINAKYYMESASRSAESAEESAELAKKYRDESAATTPDGYEALVKKVDEIDIKATTETTFEDSVAGGGVKIKSIVGNYEQDFLSGKNQLYYPYSETTHKDGDITWTDNGDGTVKASGTASANSYFYFASVRSLKAGAYIISGCPSGGDTSTYDLRVVNNADTTIFYAKETGNGVFFELTEDTDVRIYARVVSGTTINDVFAPMIRLATIEDAAWEPPTGGYATPNPICPQKLKNVEIREIKTCGKNVFNIALNRNRTNVGVTATIDVENQSMTLNGTGTGSGALPSAPQASKFKANIGDTITLSAKIIGGSATTGGTSSIAYMNFWVDGAIYAPTTRVGSILAPAGTINATTDLSNQKQQVVVTEDIISSDGYIYPAVQSYVRAGDVYNDLVIVKQLEINTKATEYRPYEETVILLSNPITLKKIETVKDQLVEKDGTLKIFRRVGQTIFDGVNNKATSKYNATDEYGISFACSKSSGNSDVYDKAVVISGNSYDLISDYFPSKVVIYNGSNKNDKGFGIYRTASNIWFSINTDFATANGITDVDTFNAWLQNNNVTVQYELAEPYYEELPVEDQIALNALETFDEVTHLFIDSVTNPSSIEVEHGTSYVGAYTLKNQLTLNNVNKKLNDGAFQLRDICDCSLYAQAIIDDYVDDVSVYGAQSMAVGRIGSKDYMLVLFTRADTVNNKDVAVLYDITKDSKGKVVGALVKYATDLKLGHCNGATFNPITGYFYVACAGGNNGLNQVAVLSDDLEIVGDPYIFDTKEVQRPYGIAYNSEHDTFYLACANGILAEMDSDFTNVIRTGLLRDKNESYSGQSLHYDGKNITFAYNYLNSNYGDVYDTDLEFVASQTFGVYSELEGGAYYDGTLYLLVNAWNCGLILTSSQYKDGNVFEFFNARRHGGRIEVSNTNFDVYYNSEAENFLVDGTKTYPFRKLYLGYSYIGGSPYGNLRMCLMGDFSNYDIKTWSFADRLTIIGADNTHVNLGGIYANNIGNITIRYINLVKQNSVESALLSLYYCKYVLLQYVNFDGVGTESYALRSIDSVVNISGSTFKSDASYLIYATEGSTVICDDVFYNGNGAVEARRNSRILAGDDAPLKALSGGASNVTFIGGEAYESIDLAGITSDGKYGIHEKSNVTNCPSGFEGGGFYIDVINFGTVTMYHIIKTSDGTLCTGVRRNGSSTITWYSPSPK